MHSDISSLLDTQKLRILLQLLGALPGLETKQNAAGKGIRASFPTWNDYFLPCSSLALSLSSFLSNTSFHSLPLNNLPSRLFFICWGYSVHVVDDFSNSYTIWIQKTNTKSFWSIFSSYHLVATVPDFSCPWKIPSWKRLFWAIAALATHFDLSKKVQTSVCQPTESFTLHPHSRFIQPQTLLRFWEGLCLLKYCPRVER